ncbi:fimbria/pilus outer membrane usher protein [Rheinheimera texasensis]|uniref:fimbria/pilus outer membrane usher protein n=1 Tax=Rheinheimera texasensis TaxID=306205 RepID=UPI0032B15AA4
MDRSARQLLCSVGLCLSLAARAADEPAPLLYLNLLINDWHTGQTLLVKTHAGGFMLQTAPLSRLLPALQLPEQEWTDSRSLPLQQIDYQIASQQLRIRLPEHWLPPTRIRHQSVPEATKLNYGNAMILNYDLVAEHSTRQQPLLGASLDLNLSHQQLQFRHQQVLLHQQQHSGVVRLDTTLNWQDYNGLHSLQLGDLITPASNSGQAYRLAGVQWRRNFSLRPDLITYPLPELSHQLALPSSTDLFIQGIKTFSADLPPGPVFIESQPMVNGAGVATFVSTDLFGRAQQVEQAFYVADTLLAPGLSDYAISLGLPRLGYGQANSNYAGKPAWVGAYRYGQQPDRTLGFSAEHFDRLFGLSAEVQQQLGLAGVLGASVSHSSAAGQGTQWRLSYSYLAADWQINASHLQRDSGFADLASYYGAQLLARRQSQLGISWHTGDGSAALNVLQQQYGREPSERYVNLSYSLASDSRWSGFLALNYHTGQQALRVSLSVSYQFDQQLRGAVFASGGKDQPQQQSLSLHQSRVDLHGWSWAAQQSRAATQQSSQFYGNYRNAYSDSYLSFSHQAGQNRWSGGSRGSLVAASGEWFLTEPVSQAFAVVDTQGLAGIDIYNSHRYVATSNARGKALVPHLLANLPNLISIDPLQLPLDSQVRQYQQEVIPAGITGINIGFEIKQQALLLLKVRLPSGHYAPLGSQLLAWAAGRDTDAVVATVGWDGEVQLPAIWAGQPLRLRVPAAGGTDAGAAEHAVSDQPGCVLTLPVDINPWIFVPLQCRYVSAGAE